MVIPAITEEIVLEALRKVQDPELHKDLVSLNMIRDILINGSEVQFSVVLTTPACPLKKRIEKETREAVQAIPGVTKVKVNLDAKVPYDGKSREGLGLKIRNAIAVGSGKGGVGKSTVAANVAVALAQSGAAVGLLDADIYGPNIPTMMGVSQIPGLNGKKMIPPQAYGVKLMSIGFLVKPGQPLIWRGPMLHSAIHQFLEDVDWGELDYLIIDLPPGTGDAQLSLMQSISLSGGIIVTLPQKVSIDDASRGLSMFKTLNVPILGVIENMSYLELPDGKRMDIFGTGGGEKLALEADVPFLGYIPMDPAVRQGGDSGLPVVVSDPDCASAAALRGLAERIAAQLSIAAIEPELKNFPVVN